MGEALALSHAGDRIVPDVLCEETQSGLGLGLGLGLGFLGEEISPGEELIEDHPKGPDIQTHARHGLDRQKARIGGRGGRQLAVIQGEDRFAVCTKGEKPFHILGRDVSLPFQGASSEFESQPGLTDL